MADMKLLISNLRSLLTMEGTGLKFLDKQIWKMG
jgi:hypothetical protein